MLAMMKKTRQSRHWCPIALACRRLLMIFGVCLWGPCLKAVETRSFNSVLLPSRPLSDQAEIRNKARILGELKSFQGKQLQNLSSLDQSIRKILQETQSISFKSGADPLALEKQLRLLPVRLRTLNEKREELHLRRDFIDQLIFQVDTKWTTLNLRTFLEQQLIEMAMTELTREGTRASTPQAELWRFYINLSIAIREIPEPREDLLGFVTGYMDFSTIKDPKSPLAFLESRNYTNGQISQAANPAKREEVGSFVDKRLRELGLLKSPSPSRPHPSPNRADIELRTQFTTVTPERDTSNAPLSATPSDLKQTGQKRPKPSDGVTD